MKRILFVLLLLLPVLTRAQIVSFTVSADTLCQDSCITLINTSTGTIDSIRWYVYGDTSTIPHNDTVTVCFLSAGIDSVRLYVYDSGRIDSTTQMVWIKLIPHPKLFDSLICGVATHDIYLGYNWYYWEFGAPVFSNGDTTCYSSSTYGISAYVVVDSNGCFGRSDTVARCLIGTIKGDSVVCLGTPASFTDSTSGGIWSISNTSIALINSSGLATGISVGIATITYTVGTGFQSKRIKVGLVPSPIFGQAYICEYGIVTLYDTTEGGGTWTLTSPDGNYDLDGSGLNYASISNYGLEVDDMECFLGFTDTSGCSTGIGIEGQIPNLPLITGNTIIDVDSTTTLYEYEQGAWSSNDTSIATIGSTSGVVTAVSVGSTTVTYYSSLGCIVTTSLTVQLPTVIPPPIIPPTYANAMYPNPAFAELTITASDTIISISVSNILGQQFYNNMCNAQEIQINVADFPAGMYFVKINGSQVRKFVKE